METAKRHKDYFSFESIRDKNSEVVCYHITMIGTIEQDGEARIRSDLGTDNNKRMAFGRLTLHGCDKKIKVLLDETESRVYYHSYNMDEGTTDIISFAAKDWRADEIYNFTAGDRVLIEGRAYFRPSTNPERDPRPEMSVTVTGQFMLGRKRRPMRTLLPQEDI